VSTIPWPSPNATRAEVAAFRERYTITKDYVSIECGECGNDAVHVLGTSRGFVDWTACVLCKDCLRRRELRKSKHRVHEAARGSIAEALVEAVCSLFMPEAS